MKKILSFLSFFTIVVLLGAGCFASKDSQSQVVTSFYPLYYFTKQIAGSHVEIINLTPAGVEPHDFDPTARDIARIQDSKLLVVNGLGFEPWVEKIKGDVEKSGVNVVETAYPAEGSGKVDPHIWLSPVVAKNQVTTIETSLVKADPVHQGEYHKNAEQLLQKLNELDTDFRSGLSVCSKKSFVTSHAAFNYLAQEYGLEQRSIAGLSPDAEPSAKDLSEVVKFVKENQIKYIFFESLASPKLSETLARETGAQTLVLNPIEGLTEEEIREGKDYFSVMRENLKNLRTALECK